MRCGQCRRRKGKLVAWIAVGIGAFILLVLILPVWIWWVLCALALLGGGLFLLCK